MYLDELAMVSLVKKNEAQLVELMGLNFGACCTPALTPISDITAVTSELLLLALAFKEILTFTTGLF